MDRFIDLTTHKWTAFITEMNTNDTYCIHKIQIVISGIIFR